VTYEAGIDCRKVDEGVIGERNDTVMSIGSVEPVSMWYVKLVVDAS
jgi:hypothetical protein